MTIHKIICPFDFSAASMNAAHYAAQLCRQKGLALELLYVQPFLLPALAIPGKPVQTGEPERFCRQVKKTFGITCTYEIETVRGMSEQELFAKIPGGSLLVVGTNGADDFFQRVFGSNTWNIVKKADVPVLVIPENVEYAPVKRIVFAWDYAMKDAFIFNLQEFAGFLRARITFLHVSKHASGASRDVFNALSEKIAALPDHKDEVEFQRYYSSDLREALDLYMHEKKAEVLAFTLHKGRLLRKVLQGSSEKVLPSYPLLVFRSY